MEREKYRNRKICPGRRPVDLDAIPPQRKAGQDVVLPGMRTG